MSLLQMTLSKGRTVVLDKITISKAAIEIQTIQSLIALIGSLSILLCNAIAISPSRRP